MLNSSDTQATPNKKNNVYLFDQHANPGSKYSRVLLTFTGSESAPKLKEKKQSHVLHLCLT